MSVKHLYILTGMLALLGVASCTKQYTCTCYNPTSPQVPMPQTNTYVKGKNRETAEQKCIELDSAQGPNVICKLQ